MAVSSTHHQYGIEQIRLDPLKWLPEEINLNIHSHLNLPELTICCGVSKKWKKIASHNMFWENAGKLVKPELPEGINYKTYFDNRAVMSFDCIIKKLKKTFETIPLDQKFRFTCQFLYNPQYRICIEIGVGKVQEHESISDLNETCIFMKKLSDEDTYKYPLETIMPYIRLKPFNPFTNVLSSDCFTFRSLDLLLPAYSQSDQNELELPEDYSAFRKDLNTILETKIFKLVVKKSFFKAVKIAVIGLGVRIIGRLVIVGL